MTRPRWSARRVRIEASLGRAVKGGKLDSERAREVSGLIELTTELEAIAGADLVLEAVPEDQQLKLDVMEAINQAWAR